MNRNEGNTATLLAKKILVRNWFNTSANQD